jgi:hypothetical protein
VGLQQVRLGPAWADDDAVVPNAIGDIGEEGKIIIELVKAPKRED